MPTANLDAVYLAALIAGCPERRAELLASLTLTAAYLGSGIARSVALGAPMKNSAATQEGLT